MRKLIALVMVYLIISLSFSFVSFGDVGDPSTTDSSVEPGTSDINPSRVVGVVVLGDSGNEDYVLNTDVNIIVRVDIIEEDLGKEGVKADLNKINSVYGSDVEADECEDQGNKHWFCYWRGLQVDKIGKVSFTFDVTDRAGNSLSGNDDGVDAIVNIREIREGDNWDVYADSVDTVNKNFLELGDLSVIVPLQIVSKGDAELLSFDVDCELGSNVVSYETVVYPDLSGAYLEVILSGMNTQGSPTRIDDDVREREVNNNLNYLENVDSESRGGNVFRTGSFVYIDKITGFFSNDVTGMVISDEIKMDCKSIIEQQRVSGMDVVYFEPEEDEFEVNIELRDSLLPDAEETTLEDLKVKPFGFLEGPYKLLKNIVDFATGICSFSTRIEEVLSLLALMPVVGPMMYPTWQKFTNIWYGKNGGGFREYCEYVTCSDCSAGSRSALFRGPTASVVGTGYVAAIANEEDTAKEQQSRESEAAKAGDILKGGPIVDPFKSIYGALMCKPVCVSGVVFFLEKWRAIAEGEKRCKQVALANSMGTHVCSEWMAGAVCQEITGELWEIGVGSQLRGMFYRFYNNLWEKTIGKRLNDLLGEMGPWKSLIDAYIVLEDLGKIGGKSKEVSGGLAKPVELGKGEVIQNPNRYPEPEVRYD